MAVIHELNEKVLPDNCLVFKHSTRCPISGAAARVVKEAEFESELFWINVVEQRELSNWVAEAYSVRHESPQLLQIKDGKVVNSWTHSKIRPEVLEGL
jgi:bacillithiol system protein YtxJ